MRIASRTTTAASDERDWYDVGGGESGWIAPDPEGLADRLSPALTTDCSPARITAPASSATSTAWPDNPMGCGAEAMKYRFQWNFPIVFSPHDPNTLYAAATSLFKTTNEGQSWEVISGDLTRNDKSKQGSSGGPITKDNTSIEYYCTIFTVMESPVQEGADLGWLRRWTGARHARWRQELGERHAAKDMPEWIQINSIDASPLDAGTAYCRGDDVQVRRLPAVPIQDHRLRQEPGRRSIPVFPRMRSRA